MKAVKKAAPRLEPLSGCSLVDLSRVDRDLGQEDLDAYRRCVSVDLSPEQRRRVAEPERRYPQQERILAVHWHPEFIPLDLCMQRVRAMFPGAGGELIIPTQHNELLRLGDYSGVEVDCYSRGFNRKVQLLLHFRSDCLAGADKLKAMLQHTFAYRTSQLEEYLDALTQAPREEWRQQAAAAAGADADLVEFCAVQAGKLRRMLQDLWGETPRGMVKNKLVRDFFDSLRPRFGDRAVERAQFYLREVKNIVKAHFSLGCFYRASEVIEETRSLGGGVVIPHPEQFWPVLLADYDVDGIEVWNPQSREYTEFLIHVVKRHNETKRTKRPLLIFMGDDCHLGEKVKDPRAQDREKAGREVGLQPAWDDMSIRKSLILCDMSRDKVIAEYQARLG